MALKGVDVIQLSTTLQVIYTVPAGFATRYISMIFCSRHSSAVRVTAHHIPTGGSAANANMIIEHNSASEIAAGETREEGYSRVMNAGDSIEAKANVNTVLNMHFSCEEVAV